MPGLQRLDNCMSHTSDFLTYDFLSVLVPVGINKMHGKKKKSIAHKLRSISPRIVFTNS